MCCLPTDSAVPPWFPFSSPFYKKSPKNTIFEHFLLYLASFWYYLCQVKISHFRFVSFWYYLCSMTHLEEPKGNHFYVQHELYHAFIFFFFGGYTPKTPVKFMHKKSNDCSLLPLHMNSMYYLRIITLLYFPLFAGSTLTPKLSASEYLPSIQLYNL